MKLLLINNEFPPIGGGGSTVTKYALKHLVAAGHEVTLITSRFKDLPHRETVHGALVIRIPAVRRYADWCAPWELITFGISAVVFTWFYSWRHRIDFIQAYFAVPAGFVAWVISYVSGPPFRRASIPYAVYFGGSDIPNANPSRFKLIYPFITPLLRAIWRRAEFRTVCSQELVRLAQASDPTSSFLLIPNGVETARFKPVDRPPNAKVKLLFIGRLIPRKGFQRVVKALPQIRNLTATPFEVEVIGTGTYLQQLDTLAADLGVADLIKYVGTISYDQLEVAYQAADIFVLTSLSEGMPAVILEAMGCGLPILASEVGGNNEIVKEGENGYLVVGEDIDKLAHDLVRLIDDPELRKKMGARSRELSLQYDWTKIMNRYNDLYLEHANK